MFWKMEVTVVIVEQKDFLLFTVNFSVINQFQIQTKYHSNNGDIKEFPFFLQ